MVVVVPGIICGSLVTAIASGGGGGGDGGGRRVVTVAGTVMVEVPGS